MQYVVLQPGAAIVHHADAFGLIRSGRVDCSVLGAYEVARRTARSRTGRRTPTGEPTSAASAGRWT